MPPSIAYDLTRLCYAPPTPTPRGIDRVEIALAEGFFGSWPGDCVAILPTPWGVRALDRGFGLKVLEHTRAVWKEDVAAADDPAYAFLRAALQRAPFGTRRYRSSQLPPPPTWRAVSARIFAMAREIGLPLGPEAGRATPQGTVYLNLGHVGLAVDRLLAWLPRRPDIKPVFMLHDAIPLDHPEFVTPGSRAFYERMLVNTARHARGLIVTTESAKGAILSALGAAAPPPERIFASPLPVDDLFRRPVAADDLGAISYFVFCGSIEPRKNLALLLTIWPRIVAALGEAAPSLVIVGARTSRVCETAALLDHGATMGTHVIEVEGLSTDGLQRLLAGARALLMPSFAEGFGIPVVEALAGGTPVIASDIGAHREAGGAAADYLDPTDGPAWTRAILARCATPGKARLDHPIAAWPEYRAALANFLMALR